MKNGKVLVIDFDPEALKQLTDFVQGEGFKAVTARDGLAGWDQFKSQQPDLVIMEAMLPKLNGFELCKKIVTDSKGSVPVIMITGVYRESSYKVEALQIFGASAYYGKPWDRQELKTKVRQLMGGKNDKTDNKEKDSATVRIEDVDEQPAASSGLRNPEPIPNMENAMPNQSQENLQNGKADPKNPVKDKKPGLSGDIEGMLKDTLADLGFESKKPVKPEPKPEPKPEIKYDFKMPVKPEHKPEPKPEIKYDFKMPVKPEPKPEPKPEIKYDFKMPVKPEPKPEPKPEIKYDFKMPVKPEPKPEPKSEPKPEPKPEIKIDFKMPGKPEPKPEIKIEPKIEPSVKPKFEFKPEPRVEKPIEIKVPEKKDFEPRKAEAVREEPKPSPAIEKKPGYEKIHIEKKHEETAHPVPPSTAYTPTGPLGGYEEHKKKTSPAMIGGIAVGVVAAAAVIFFVVLKPKKSPTVPQKPVVSQVTPSQANDTAFVPTQTGGDTNPDAKTAAKTNEPAKKAPEKPAPVPAEADTVAAAPLLPNVTPTKPPETKPDAVKTDVAAAGQPPTETKPPAETKPAADQPATKPAEQPTVKAGDLVDIGDVDVAPVKINEVRPQATPQAIRMKISGQITVNCLVSETGIVKKTEIIKGMKNSGGLEKAAEDAAMKLVFKPAMKSGVPVKCWKSVTFDFKL